MMVVNKQLSKLEPGSCIDEAIANGASIIDNKASKIRIFQDKIIYNVSRFFINFNL